MQAFPQNRGPLGHPAAAPPNLWPPPGLLVGWASLKPQQQSAWSRGPSHKPQRLRGSAESGRREDFLNRPWGQLSSSLFAVGSPLWAAHSDTLPPISPASFSLCPAPRCQAPPPLPLMLDTLEETVAPEPESGVRGSVASSGPSPGPGAGTCARRWRLGDKCSL